MSDKDKLLRLHELALNYKEGAYTDKTFSEKVCEMLAWIKKVEE